MSGNLGNAVEVEPEVLLPTKNFLAVWIAKTGMICCPYAGMEYIMREFGERHTLSCNESWGHKNYLECDQCPFLNRYGIKK